MVYNEALLNFKIEGTHKKSGEHKIVQTIIPNSEQKKKIFKLEQKPEITHSSVVDLLYVIVSLSNSLVPQEFTFKIFSTQGKFWG